MTEEAKQARKAYKRAYNRANAAKVNEYQRNWRKANPDKVRGYQESYWQKKAQSAAEGNT